MFVRREICPPGQRRRDLRPSNRCPMVSHLFASASASSFGAAPPLKATVPCMLDQTSTSRSPKGIGLHPKHRTLSKVNFSEEKRL